MPRCRVRSLTQCARNFTSEGSREKSMNSIEEPNKDRLARFFRERILPIAENAAASGIEIFPLRPDRSYESYFVDRQPGESYIHTIDPDSMEAELSRLWSSNDALGMKDLAKPIVELAEELREKEPESDDVSPFIYAMF